MLYINDPERPYKTYEEVTQFAIDSGIEAKRVYIYLAALGIKSALARVISSDGADYLPAQKIAVQHGEIVSSIDICTTCKGLVVNG